MERGVYMQLHLAENTCKYLNLSGIRSEAVFSVEGYYQFMDANTARMILLDINLGIRLQGTIFLIFNADTTAVNTPTNSAHNMSETIQITGNANAIL